MSKFITPVSMKVAQIEFDYLKKELYKLGYEATLINNIHPENNYIATNLGNTNHYFSNIDDSDSKSYNRYFIDTYNPELFLVLAAMTDTDIPIVGEYMKCIQKTTDLDDNYNEGEIFKLLYFNDIGSKKYGLSDKYSRNHFRKATKEELIAHFSKDTFVLPERWFVRSTSDETDRVLIDWRGGGYSGIRKQSVMTSNRFWMYKDCVKEYTEITFDQFSKYVFKQDNKQTKIEMKHTINLDQLRLIFNVACANWQEKIKVYAGRAVFPQVTVDFTNDEVKTMYGASNSEQKAVLNSIFTEYNKDNNPFKEHKDNEKLITELSNSCFGRTGILELGQSIIASRNLPTYLRNRSIFVKNEYKVILHEKMNGGTIIEFQQS